MNQNLINNLTSNQRSWSPGVSSKYSWTKSSMVRITQFEIVASTNYKWIRTIDFLHNLFGAYWTFYCFYERWDYSRLEKQMLIVFTISSQTTSRPLCSQSLRGLQLLSSNWNWLPLTYSVCTVLKMDFVRKESALFLSYCRLTLYLGFVLRHFIEIVFHNGSHHWKLHTVQ